MRTRKLLIFCLLFFAGASAFGQFYPFNLTGGGSTPGTVRRSPFSSMARAPGLGYGLLSDAHGNYRAADFPAINPTVLISDPSVTGNTTNLSRFVSAPSGLFYIDWTGRRYRISYNPINGTEIITSPQSGTGLGGTLIRNTTISGQQFSMNWYNLSREINEAVNTATGGSIVEDKNPYLAEPGPFYSVTNRISPTGGRSVLELSRLSWGFFPGEVPVAGGGATSLSVSDGPGFDNGASVSIYQDLAFLGAKGSSPSTYRTFGVSKDAFFLHGLEAGTASKMVYFNPTSEEIFMGDPPSGGGAAVNIYTDNGTADEDRIYNGGNFDLTLEDVDEFNLTAAAVANILAPAGTVQVQAVDIVQIATGDASLTGSNLVEIATSSGGAMRVRTPGVAAGTATVGQVLKLQNATTGAVEFAPDATSGGGGGSDNISMQVSGGNLQVTDGAGIVQTSVLSVAPVQAVAGLDGANVVTYPGGSVEVSLRSYSTATTGQVPTKSASGGNLTWVNPSAIAPVQSVTGSNGVTVTNSSGTYNAELRNYAAAPVGTYATKSGTANEIEWRGAPWYNPLSQAVLVEEWGPYGNATSATNATTQTQAGPFGNLGWGRSFLTATNNTVAATTSGTVPDFGITGLFLGTTLTSYNNFILGGGNGANTAGGMYSPYLGDTLIFRFGLHGSGVDFPTATEDWYTYGGIRVRTDALSPSSTAANHSSILLLASSSNANWRLLLQDEGAASTETVTAVPLAGGQFVKLVLVCSAYTGGAGGSATFKCFVNNTLVSTYTMSNTMFLKDFFPTFGCTRILSAGGTNYPRAINAEFFMFKRNLTHRL